ncbi:zinc finger protein 592 [Osmerus eperlanus]|uniref:zinc finger protein 592 n=1 Tax=Osmerus eperlanus TaxID=29151 RepID=UPI002E0ED5AF
MGDMKTPDFDDLLAAFDIPDATSLDAKETLPHSQDEAEGQLKHTGMCVDNGLRFHQTVGTSDVPAVSVIVKNTSRQESLESVAEREGQHLGPPLQNGFKGPGTFMESHQLSHCGSSKSFMSTLNGDSSGGLLGKAPIQNKPEGTPSFSQSCNQFSPISSPESEDTQSNCLDVCPKQEQPFFPDVSVSTSIKPPSSDNQKKQQYMFDSWHKEDCDAHGDNMECSGKSTKAEKKPDNHVREHQDKTDCQSSSVNAINNQHSVGINCNTRAEPVVSSPNPSVKSSKLSSCLEALVALNARKDSSEQTNPRDSPLARNATTFSQKVTLSPLSPRSPLEAVKRMMRQSESPVSLGSDCSDKASPPALVSGSPPAIPRVRIKTIKTTTGQIKRTVTSVLPDSETEEVQSACDSSPSQSMITETYSSISPCQSHNVSDDPIGVPIRGALVVTPSAAVSPVKSEGNSKKTGITPSPTIFHNVGGPAMRSVPGSQQGQKQKRSTSCQAGNATNTNFLPKAMHLANLNLVPHSVAASVTARSTHQQNQQHAISSVVCNTVPLVHQVKKATPIPRTAIPSSAAGTLNRLLNNTNPVPTYVPNLNPPPESNISLPPRGYCCLECGDSFGVEKSLAYHYSRRSVHIEVACTHCAKSLVFFNKCALLAHAREHKNKGMVMQCSQLVMKPIAERQMFVPLRTESSLYVGSHMPLSCSAKGQPVMPLYPDKVIRHRLRCLECNQQLSDYRALAGHYQRLSDEKDGLMCKVCSMLLPNKCSYKAHQRIHAHKSPYCCPECGALSRSVDIQKHVKENCLHYARKAGYKCLHCERVFTSFNVHKRHIEEKHCEVFHKCSICPVAFKSSEGCQMHMKNKHSASKLSPQSIFKCCCEKVFKKKQLLFQHFHQNAKMFATCVFKCPECTSVFTHKLLLMHHFKSVHGGIFREEPEKSTKPTERTSKHPDVTLAPSQQKVPSDVTRKKANLTARVSKPSVKSAGWTCGECLLWLPDRDAYLSHMKNSHGRSLKRYPCRKCDRSFNSSTSLRRHIRNDHDVQKKTYICWYCTNEKTIFNSNVMLRNHISLMHGIKNPDFSLMPDTATQCKTLGEELISKRPAMDTHREQQDCVTCPGSFSAKRLKKQFRCSKCGFVTEDGTQFLQHIPQHKLDDNTPQCLHCGLCFASQLSLNRHLFIVHKVKESEEVWREKVNRPEVREEEQEEEKRGEKLKSAMGNETKNLLPLTVETVLSQSRDTTRLHLENTNDSNSTYSSHLESAETVSQQQQI